MARGRPYRFRRFGRGLNTADSVYNLAEGFEDDPGGRGSEARDLLNVVSRARGTVRKRNGTVGFVPRAGVKDLSVVDSDSAGLVIYSTTTGALRAADESGVESTIVASGLSATAPWTFKRLPDTTMGPYYGINGVDSPRAVTVGLGVVTWVATTGTVPNGKYMAYVNNRVWIAGTSGTDYSLFFSAVGDPLNWPVANVVQFEPKDGQPITGISACGPYLLVFKQSAIYVVYDLDTGANRKLTDEAGTQSPRSIVSADGGCYFLDGERGVMYTNGSTVKRLSEVIHPTIQRIGQAQLNNTTAAFWRNHYYVSTVLDGTTAAVLDYDTELDSWWMHSNNMKALAVFDRGANVDLIGAGTVQIERLYVDNTQGDLGNAFTSYWSGPFHSFGSPDLAKRCREIHFDGSGKVDVYVQPDFYVGAGQLEGNSDFGTASSDAFGGAGTFGGDGLYGGGVLIGEDSLYALGIGRVWSLTIGNTTLDDWEMDSYTMRMVERQD